MAMNLDAVLRIAAKVVGLEEVTKLERGIAGAEKTAQEARKSFAAVVNSASWQVAAAGAAAIGLALGTSVKAAMEFESAMADVRKVVPGLDSAEGLRNMRNEILNLSRELPVSAEGLAAIMAAAGQAGIPREELAQFTRQAAQMGVAFDITADQAGEAMAKLRTSLGLSQPEVVDLADAMNYLSNNMASSAAEVNEFMLRVGAVGKQVAMTTEQTAALGSAMIAAGAAPEVAGTSFRNLIKALTKGESATERQSAAFKKLGLDVTEVSKNMQTDAIGTIRDVFQRISQMPAEMRVSTISEIFGDEARALTPLITNMKLFDQAIGLVGDKSQYAGSMLQEFQARAGTSANNFQLLENNIKALQIAIGEGLLPAINAIFSVLTPILSVVADLAGRFPVLTAVVVSLTAALAGLVLVAPAIVSFITLLGSLKAALGVTSLAAGWAGLQTVVIVAVSGMTSALTGFVGWIGTTLVPGILAFLGPAGWTVLAIAAVVAAAIAFREPLIEFFQWLWEWGEPIRKFWVDAWNGAKDAIVAFFSWLPGAINSGFEALWRLRETIRQFWIDVWENVKATVGGFFSWFASAIASGFDALWKWGEPIRQFWYDAWERVKGFAKAYFDYLVGVFDWGLKAAWAIVDTLLIQPYIALWENVIRKPAIAAFNWLQSNVFQPIGRAFTTYVVIPLQNAWNTAIQSIRNGAIAAWNGVVTAWRVAGSWFMQNVVTPISDAFRFVVNVVSDTASRAWAAFTNVWQQVSGWFQSNVATPVSNAWRTVITGVADAVTKVRTTIEGVWRAIASAFTSYVAKPISDAWNALIKLLPDAMEKAVKFVQNAWTGMINGIKGALRGLLQSIANAINSVGSEVNKLIRAFNALPGSDIPLVPTLTVPAFAQGGVVGRKTLAMVGDGGETEYIIPQSKMAAASQRFLSGARGSSVIPSSSSTARGGTSAPVINITTGPVMEFNGTRYVTVDDFERGVRQVVNGTIGRLRTPAAKIAIGIR